MQLNKKGSSFYFELPKDFLHSDIENLFFPIIKKTSEQYKNVNDYINSSIQGITLPGINMEYVTQFLNSKPTTWKAGENIIWGIEKDFEITFNLSDGCLNWIILLTNFEYFQKSSNKEFFNDFFIHITDSNNYNIFSMKLSKIILLDLPSQEFSWTDNNSDAKSFSIKCRFNEFNIIFNID